MQSNTPADAEENGVKPTSARHRLRARHMRRPGKGKGRKGPAIGGFDFSVDDAAAIGQRLRTARELAGIGLSEAADALGYAQPVQLSNTETGQRLPTLWMVLKLAELYGTSADYILGMTADPDRDPVAAATRWMASRVSADVTALARQVIHVNSDLMRKVMPSAARGHRLATLAIEAQAAFAALQGNDKARRAFENTPGSATILRRMTLLDAAARDAIGDFERAQRLVAMHSMREAMIPGASRQDPQPSLLPPEDPWESRAPWKPLEPTPPKPPARRKKSPPELARMEEGHD